MAAFGANSCAHVQRVFLSQRRNNSVVKLTANMSKRLTSQKPFTWHTPVSTDAEFAYQRAATGEDFVATEFIHPRSGSEADNSFAVNLRSQILIKHCQTPFAVPAFAQARLMSPLCFSNNAHLAKCRGKPGRNRASKRCTAACSKQPSHKPSQT